MSAQKRKPKSFVVHLWLEPREIESEHPALRGSIENLRTRDKRYFTDLETLAKLIREITEGSPSPENKRKPIA